MISHKKVPSKDQHVLGFVKIMIFGTFDMIHKGHLNFFKQARALVKPADGLRLARVPELSRAPKPQPFLIVSIARDSNVERIKGRRPRHTQTQRKQLVEAVKEVDKVVIGGAGDHLPHIIKEAPDIIALGYDQVAYVRGLRSALIAVGLKTKVVRLKPYKPHLYKTALIHNKNQKNDR